jgi:hypothetical protein
LRCRASRGGGIGTAAAGLQRQRVQFAQHLRRVDGARRPGRGTRRRVAADEYRLALSLGGQHQPHRSGIGGIGDDEVALVPRRHRRVARLAAAGQAQAGSERIALEGAEAEQRDAVAGGHPAVDAAVRAAACQRCRARRVGALTSLPLLREG